MNLTSEEIRLKECSQDRKENIFIQIKKDEDSYWNDECEYECLMMEYGFETPLELMNQLKMYMDDDLSKIITAASFKNRRVKKDTTDIEAVGADKLPEYVYNF